MKKEDLFYVQNCIDYQFKNPDLLAQAFKRKSFAMENGGEDNEVLEFIGDKVLDLVVVKFLSDTYGSFASDDEEYTADDYDEYFNEYDEGELTAMKSHLVQKRMLSHRIDLLRFAGFIQMGKGDYEQHVEEKDSVKEDLFEAIIGAVALDSEWNLSVLEHVVNNMLCPEAEIENDDEYENYIGKVQNWCTETTGFLPMYRVEPYSQIDLYVAGQYILGENARTLNLGWYPRFVCYLKLFGREETFKEYGRSENEAKSGAAKAAYKFIEEKKLVPTIKDEIENPNYDDAIGQLETLSRRGYFSIPTYKFKETHDGDGNPIWSCKCEIKEIDIVTNGRSSSKKDAKKQAAFDMLTFVLEN